MLAVSTNLWSKKVVGALGVYMPNAAGASFGVDKPTRYHIIDAYMVSAFFTAAVAYRPFDWLSVGVGGSVVYVRINRRSLLYPVLDGADLSRILGKSTEIEITGEDVRPAFNFGIQLWPHKTLSIGLMMLTRYDLALEGPLVLKLGHDAASVLRGNEALAQNRQVTEIPSPWIVGFGANWDITPWLEVGAEFRYYFNSVVKEMRTTITDGELKTFLPDGFVTPKNHHNSYHTGAGLVVRPPLPLQLELMTGMHYETSSSPDSTLDISAPSFNLYSFHLGGRWSYEDRLSLSLSYSHFWLLERSSSTSIVSPPANLVAACKQLARASGGPLAQHERPFFAGDKGQEGRAEAVFVFFHPVKTCARFDAVQLLHGQRHPHEVGHLDDVASKITLEFIEGQGQHVGAVSPCPEAGRVCGPQAVIDAAIEQL